MTDTLDEARFRGIFAHLGAVTAYAARRGSRDPEGRRGRGDDDRVAPAGRRTGRRFAPVALRDRPQRRLCGGSLPTANGAGGLAGTSPAPEVESLDPELDAALRALRTSDREALLLVAWEDLSPTQAAEALGISRRRSGCASSAPAAACATRSRNRSPRLSPISTWREHDHRNHVLASPRREPRHDGADRRRRRLFDRIVVAAGRGSARRARPSRRMLVLVAVAFVAALAASTAFALSHWVFGDVVHAPVSRAEYLRPRRSSSCRPDTRGLRSSSGRTPSWCAAAGAAWPSRSTRARGSATGSARSSAATRLRRRARTSVLDDLMTNRIGVAPKGRPRTGRQPARRSPTSSTPTTAATRSSSACTPTAAAGKLDAARGELPRERPVT